VLGLTKVLATDLFQDVSDELLRVAGEDAGLLEPVGVAGVKLDLRKIYIYDGKACHHLRRGQRSSTQHRCQYADGARRKVT